MQRRQVDGPIVGAPLGLAIEGNHIAGQFEPDGIDPRHKRLLKSEGVQTGKHPPKGIMPGLTHYESTRSVVKSAVMYPIVAMDRNARNGNEYITSLW